MSVVFRIVDTINGYNILRRIGSDDRYYVDVFNDGNLKRLLKFYTFGDAVKFIITTL